MNNHFVQHIFAYVICLFLSTSCYFSGGSGNGSGAQSQNIFFEGIFTPGVLVARYYDNNNAGSLRYTIDQELTIYEDHTFEMRKKTSGLYGGNMEIQTYYGRILNKYNETYNGVEHTWYTLEGSSGKYVGSWSIDTEGNAVPGKCTTYQEVYGRLHDNRAEGWHWRMRRQ